MKYLRYGPGWKQTMPAPELVEQFADEFPLEYDKGLKLLYYKMASTLFKKSPPGLADRYFSFIAPWCERVDRDTSKYMLAAAKAYKAAWDAGMGALAPGATRDDGAGVIAALDGLGAEPGSFDELLVLLLRGQVESLHSREDAAASFAAVRNNPHADLLTWFIWDAGALSYFSEMQVAHAAENITEPGLTYSWKARSKTNAKAAIVVSADPTFYRIYGPMMLFNAQQVPETDFVFLICASEESTRQLVHTSRAYTAALAGLNRQKPPANVSYYAVDTPTWVNDERTFYACARFLALPDLLKRYRNVYCIDADLIMKDNPAGFLKKTAKLTLSVPKSTSSIGIVPWRRHMAGSLVASQQLADSPTLEKLNGYISAGLQNPHAWTLDQNALSYAVETSLPGEFEPLEAYGRPVMVSNFMNRWEHNYPTS